MSLQEKLNSFKENSMANKPDDIKNIMFKSSKELKDSNLLDKSPKVGDKLKGFNLKNHLGDSISLDLLIKEGPVVLTFYRGGWCPYCNLQLKAYQDVLQDIKGLGATLVAITPELPDSSLTTKEKNEIGFEVLSDINSLYARELGLVFTLSQEIKELYSKFGHDLEKFNGPNQFDLPFPSTLIINRDGVVTYTFIDTDYTKRAEPDILISELKKLV